MPDEREERFIHRIEAFSDIVIGFSLAQLGATLVVPGHAQALLDHPAWIFGFAWTFALVCLMWWNHNRIFRTSFKPTRVSMFLNFILLATIVLLVYFAQVFARSILVHDALIAGRLYFGALAASAIETGLLYRVNNGNARGAIVNLVSGGLQAITVIACCFTGDRQIALPVMGFMVLISFTIGGFIGRRTAPSPAAAAR